MPPVFSSPLLCGPRQVRAELSVSKEGPEDRMGQQGASVRVVGDPSS